MGGVSRYFSKVLGSRIDSTLPKNSRSCRDRQRERAGEPFVDLWGHILVPWGQVVAPWREASDCPLWNRAQSEKLRHVVPGPQGVGTKGNIDKPAFFAALKIRSRQLLKKRDTTVFLRLLLLSSCEHVFPSRTFLCTNGWLLCRPIPLLQFCKISLFKLLLFLVLLANHDLYGPCYTLLLAKHPACSAWIRDCASPKQHWWERCSRKDKAKKPTSQRTTRAGKRKEY